MHGKRKTENNESKYRNWYFVRFTLRTNDNEANWMRNLWGDDWQIFHKSKIFDSNCCSHQIVEPEGFFLALHLSFHRKEVEIEYLSIIANTILRVFIIDRKCEILNRSKIIIALSLSTFPFRTWTTANHWEESYSINLIQKTRNHNAIKGQNRRLFY